MSVAVKWNLDVATGDAVWSTLFYKLSRAAWDPFVPVRDVGGDVAFDLFDDLRGGGLAAFPQPIPMPRSPPQGQLGISMGVWPPGVSSERIAVSER